MTQILFVQGAGPHVHDEWDNKLVESLRRELGKGYDVRYPRMPNEDTPTLASWQPALEKDLAALRDGDIVVGHSIGGTMMISVLADSAPKSNLGAIVLISAPFIGKGGWKSDEVEPQSDLGERLPPSIPVLLYHGDKDKIAPTAHLDLYSAAIPRAHVHRLSGRDHQMNNDLSEVAADIRDLGSHATHGKRTS